MSSTPKTLNVTEQHQLLDALLNKDAPHKSFRKGIRNYLIGCLLLEAGLRVGEVVALEMSHLNFHGFPVHSIVLTENITKNHKERSIPVSLRLKAAIEEYFSENSYLFNKPDNEKVFAIFPCHKNITTRQVERIINSAGMKALGRPVHPHMLRHTFATKLMRVTDMRTVQDMLGHSNITSTQIYTHPNEDDKRNAIKHLDATVDTDLVDVPVSP